MFFLLALSLPVSYFFSQIFYYLLLALVLWHCRCRLRLFPNARPLNFAVGAMSLAFLIAIACSLDVSVSLSKTTMVLQFLFLHVILNAALPKRIMTRVYGLFVAAATLSAFFGYGEYILGTRRISGLMGDYQTMAHMLVVSILVCTAFYLYTRQRFYLLCLAAQLPALYLTFTRSAWLGLGLGWLLIFYFRWRKGLFVYLSLLFFIIGLALTFPASETGDLVLSILFPTDRVSSRFIVNSDRIDMYHASLKIAADYPITGIGFDTLTGIWQTDRYDLRTSKPYDRISSNPFHIMVSTGFLGLAAWLFFQLCVLVYLLKAMRGTTSPRAKAGILAGIGIYTALNFSGLFEPIFFDGELRLAGFFFLGLGLVLGSVAPATQGKSPSPAL